MAKFEKKLKKKFENQWRNWKIENIQKNVEKIIIKKCGKMKKIIIFWNIFIKIIGKKKLLKNMIFGSNIEFFFKWCFFNKKISSTKKFLLQKKAFYNNE